MALGKAIKFVRKVGFDTQLRKMCYQSPTKQALFVRLGFDETEFDDAINMQLVKSQNWEQADHFHEIRMWFLSL